AGENVVPGDSGNLEASQRMSLCCHTYDLRRARRIEAAAVGDQRDATSESEGQYALGNDLYIARVTAPRIAHLVPAQHGERAFRERLEADDIHMPILNHRQRACHVVAIETLGGTDAEHTHSSPSLLPSLAAFGQVSLYSHCSLTLPRLQLGGAYVRTLPWRVSRHSYHQVRAR